jgi:hypothetical protein
MDNYNAEQKEAMQARSQWDKKKLMAKALMDVVSGADRDGDGREYVTHFRIATAAWRQFCGGEKAAYHDSRTKAFDEYMDFLKQVGTMYLTALTATMPVRAEQPKSKSVEERKSAAVPQVKPRSDDFGTTRGSGGVSTIQGNRKPQPVTTKPVKTPEEIAAEAAETEAFLASRRRPKSADQLADEADAAAWIADGCTGPEPTPRVKSAPRPLKEAS